MTESGGKFKNKKNMEREKRIENSRVGRSVESECLWSGIEELGLLMELLNF